MHKSTEAQAVTQQFKKANSTSLQYKNRSIIILHISGTAHVCLWICTYFASCTESEERNLDLVACPWRRLASIKKLILAEDFGLCRLSSTGTESDSCEKFMDVSRS